MPILSRSGEELGLVTVLVATYAIVNLSISVSYLSRSRMRDLFVLSLVILLYYELRLIIDTFLSSTWFISLANLSVATNHL